MMLADDAAAETAQEHCGWSRVRSLFEGAKYADCMLIACPRPRRRDQEWWLALPVEDRSKTARQTSHTKQENEKASSGKVVIKTQGLRT